MGAGSEPDDAQEQGDHEDVTTKEDAKPDGLVSAYWETIGEGCTLPTALHAVAIDGSLRCHSLVKNL